MQLVADVVGLALAPQGKRGGLFVAQDGVNGAAQNFKLVSWAAIEESLHP